GERNHAAISADDWATVGRRFSELHLRRLSDVSELCSALRLAGRSDHGTLPPVPGKHGPSVDNGTG
ncbi:unnamed protein product, partial [Amoebophrya sp. A25]